jgi:hypothetical protein
MMFSKSASPARKERTMNISSSEVLADQEPTESADLIIFLLPDDVAVGAWPRYAGRCLNWRSDP